MAKSPSSRPGSPRRQPAALEGNRQWRERSRVRTTNPAGQEKSAWERLPPWARHAIGLSVLLIGALWFTAPTTFGGRTLVGGDVVQWRGSAQAMLEYEAETGQDALWAPNVFSGMPGYLIHYPLKAVGIDTVPRLVREAGLWPLSHLLVLLGGAYALLFFLTRGVLPSVLGALAYGLTTYIPSLLIAGHNTKFVALAYAPWLLLAFAAVLYRPRDATWLRDVLLSLFFAIAVAVNLRAGHVQITYYTVFLGAVWWLTEAVQAFRSAEARRFGAGTLVLFCGGILGLMMSAQPYLAVWSYKAFSTRGAGVAGVEGGGMGWDYAMAWSQGFGELLTLAVANAFGGAGQTYWGPKTFTAGPHYVGAVVILLAVFGVFGVRRRATTGIGIAAVLMTLFALGENFALLNRPMFAFFPLFDSFRAPETWLAAVALALAVLAGYGVYWLARREATDEAERRKTRWVWTGAGIGLGVLAVLALLGPSLMALEKPDEAAQIGPLVAQQLGIPATDPRVGPATDGVMVELRTERAGLLRRDSFRSFLFLALAAALMLLFRRETIPGWAMQGGLALLVLLDLGGVARRYFNEDDPALRRRGGVEAAVPRYAFDTFIQQQVEAADGPGHFRTLNLAASPFSDGRSAFFYESIGGYHGAKLGVYQDFLDQVVFPEGGLNPAGLDLLSTRYVVAGQPLPGMPPVFRDPETGLVVLENTAALPRAFLVDSVRVLDDAAATAEAMRDPAYDPRRLAFVLGPVPQGLDLSYYDGPPAVASVATPTAADSTTEAAGEAADSVAGAPVARFQRFTPREVVYEVQTDRPRLLVFSEVYYPAGWTATVDDAPAPILRADYALRGVPVPAGRHIVAMRYSPEINRQSMEISWASALVVYLGALVLGGLLWYRKGAKTKS